MANDYLITRADFHSWLLSLPPTAIIGESGECRSCPIATCIQDTLGPYETLVMEEYTDYDCESYDNPDWANDFIAHTDKHEKGTSITAQKALAILAQ